MRVFSLHAATLLALLPLVAYTMVIIGYIRHNKPTVEYGLFLACIALAYFVGSVVGMFFFEFMFDPPMVARKIGAFTTVTVIDPKRHLEFFWIKFACMITGSVIGVLVYVPFRKRLVAAVRKYTKGGNLHQQ